MNYALLYSCETVQFKLKNNYGKNLHIWKRYTSEICKKMMQSMPDRIKEVIKKKVTFLTPANKNKICFFF